MVKANFTTKSGLIVNLEGDPDEIAEAVEEFDRRERRLEERKIFFEKMMEKRKERNASVHESPPRGQGLTMVLTKFINEGFFDKNRKIGEVMEKLSQTGIHPPTSTVHPLLGRLILKGKLKRTKGENGTWEYSRV